jgi:hypothetical protein
MIIIIKLRVEKGIYDNKYYKFMFNYIFMRNYIFMQNSIFSVTFCMTREEGIDLNLKSIRVFIIIFIFANLYILYFICLCNF